MNGYILIQIHHGLIFCNLTISKYVIGNFPANHDIEKKRLQDLMAFGKVVPQTKSRDEISKALEEKNRKKNEEITKEKLFLTSK